MSNDFNMVRAKSKYVDFTFLLLGHHGSEIARALIVVIITVALLILIGLKWPQSWIIIVIFTLSWVLAEVLMKFGETEGSLTKSYIAYFIAIVVATGISQAFSEGILNGLFGEFGPFWGVVIASLIDGFAVFVSCVLK